jgi:catechol 2,3-dioxygenase-like lactoylglutathione lyase family enzyme
MSYRSELRKGDRQLSKARLDNAAAVFVTSDVRRTADYYREVFGFRVVEQFDREEEAFAAIYRDNVEILLIQARRGQVQSNTARYGAGFDIFLHTAEGVDLLHEEMKAKGARIVREPAMTSYGTYEFVVEDIDGRLIGIGGIRDNEVFFRGALD